MTKSIPPLGLILDLDDTLIAERDYFESGLSAVAAWVAGRLADDEAKVRQRLMQDLAENGRDGILDRIPEPAGLDRASWRKTLLHVYRTHHPHLQPFADVAPFIARARTAGCRLGVLTDGKSCVQWRKVRGAGLEGAFDAILCTDDIDAPKPSTIGFAVMADLLGCHPQQCVYIADDARKDFIGPRQLGMDTIQVIRPLAWPLAKPAAGPDAMAARMVSSLSAAAELMFGERG